MAVSPYLLMRGIDRMSKHKKMMKQQQSVDKNVRRSEVVSAPGATIRVERFRLTDAERKSLSVNTRFSDLDLSETKKAA